MVGGGRLPQQGITPGGKTLRRLRVVLPKRGAVFQIGEKKSGRDCVDTHTVKTGAVRCVSSAVRGEEEPAESAGYYSKDWISQL